MSDYEQWAEDYALRYEPDYTTEHEIDCKAAFEAGMEAARQSLAKVPEGWKLVPIESTSDMDIAGMDSLHSSYEGYIIDRDAAEVIWNAMVGAAPAPPQEQ